MRYRAGVPAGCATGEYALYPQEEVFTQVQRILEQSGGVDFEAYRLAAQLPCTNLVELIDAVEATLAEPLHGRYAHRRHTSS